MFKDGDETIPARPPPYVPEVIAVNAPPPVAPSPARDDAAQRALAIYKRSWALVSDKDVEDEILKALQCSICFEPWTISGQHQTTVLKCGHLFGRSCIEQCLRSRKVCPLCSSKATASNLRPVYAQHVISLDAEVKEKCLQLCENEKARRLEVEAKYDASAAEFARQKLRLERLYEENQELRRKIHASGAVDPALRAQSVALPPPLAAPKLLPQFPPVGGQQQFAKRAEIEAQALRFRLTEQIKISHGRVFAFAGDTVLCTSKQTSVATKWGIWRLNMDDLRQRKFIPTTHDQLIRDLRVSMQGGNEIALTCGMDKRLTLTSLNTGSVVHSFLLPVTVWSCEWSKEDSNSLFCGLLNGCVVAFDMSNISLRNFLQRKLDAPVSVLAGPPGPPVHTLFYHEPLQMLVAANASEVRCFQRPSSPASESGVRRLRFPDVGRDFTCSCVSFDAPSATFLASFRSMAASKHIQFKLSDTLETTEQVVWNGPSAATTLTRTRIFSYPDGRNQPVAYAATGDEASQSVLLWKAGRMQQQLPPHASPVVDVQVCSRVSTPVLGSLSEGMLQLYMTE